MNSVLLVVNDGDIEVNLTQRDRAWYISVLDNQGPLHIVRFKEQDGSTLQDALDWFHTVLDAVQEYRQGQTSMSAQKLVNALELH
jgi:hypothetical protein